MRSTTSILIVEAVIKLEMDQFVPATAPITLGELMEMQDGVSGNGNAARNIMSKK
jgi:hypothetical protein